MILVVCRLRGSWLLSGLKIMPIDNSKIINYTSSSHGASKNKNNKFSKSNSNKTTYSKT